MLKRSYLIDTHTHLGLNGLIKECENNLIYSFNNYDLSFILISFDMNEYNEKSNNNLSFEESLFYLKNFISRFNGMGILIWIPYGKTKINIPLLEKFIIENRSNIYGLKLHPYQSRKTVLTKRLNPYLEIARKYDLPILIHTALDKFSYIDSVKELALKNSDINFIAAHLELGSNHLYSLKCIKEVKNLYGDTAWVDPSLLKDILKMGLIDKICFGSDAPIDGKDTLKEDIYQKYINNFYKLKKSDYDKIMYLNALKIYKIKKENLLDRYLLGKSHYLHK